MTGVSSFIIICGATLAGALVAAQGPIFAKMAIYAGGGMQAAFIAFALGLGFIAAINLFSGSSIPTLANLAKAPYWVWFGGLLGAIVILLSIFAIPKIGVANYMAAAICGQLLAAMIFDHFGFFGLAIRAINLSKIIGLGFMLLGLFFIIRK